MIGKSSDRQSLNVKINQRLVTRDPLNSFEGLLKKSFILIQLRNGKVKDGCQVEKKTHR